MSISVARMQEDMVGRKHDADKTFFISVKPLFWIGVEPESRVSGAASGN